MASFRSRSDGSHYPVHQRTLFGPPKDKALAQKISISNGSQARESTQYLSSRYEGSGHAEKVKLVRAANQAANRAGVISRNDRVSPEQRRQARDAQEVYRGLVEAHKAKKANDDPPAKTTVSKAEAGGYRAYIESNGKTIDSKWFKTEAEAEAQSRKWKNISRRGLEVSMGPAEANGYRAYISEARQPNGRSRIIESEWFTYSNGAKIQADLWAKEFNLPEK